MACGGVSVACGGISVVRDDVGHYQIRPEDRRDFENELSRQRSLNAVTPDENLNSPDSVDNAVSSNGSASALNGTITVSGPNAAEIAARIEELYTMSPTFKQAMDDLIARQGHVNLTMTADTGSAGNGWAILGGGDAMINLGDTAPQEVTDMLIFHELGVHSAMGLPDGEQAEEQTNQMMREVGYDK